MNEKNETRYYPSEPNEPPTTTATAPPERTSRTPLILLIVAAAITILACVTCLVAVLAFGFFSAWTTTSSSSGGATVVEEVEESEAFQRVTVPGAGVALDLPGSMSRVDAMADEYSGTWWYEYEEPSAPKVFIAAYRYDDWAPEITDAYLEDVIDDVEESSGNRDVSIDEIDEVVMDGYEGRQVSYSSTTQDDLREYTAAILLGREADEIFIAVYGPNERREDIDALAEWLFQSMSVWATPETYSIQDV